MISSYASNLIDDAFIEQPEMMRSTEAEKITRSIIGKLHPARSSASLILALLGVVLVVGAGGAAVGAIGMYEMPLLVTLGLDTMVVALVAIASVIMLADE